MATNAGDRSHRLVYVVRAASGLIPLLFLFYIILSIWGITQFYRPINTNFALIAAISWTLLSLVPMNAPSKSHAGSLRWIASYHIIGVAALLFVTGFVTIFVIMWSILLLITYLFSNTRGFIISTGILLLTAIADSLLLDGQNIFFNLYAAAAAIVIGGISVAMIRGTDRDQEIIEASVEQATVQHQRITTLINNLTDAIISLDPVGRVTVYNAAALNLLDTNTNIKDRAIDRIIKLETVDGKAVRMRDVLHSVHTATVRDDLMLLVGDEKIRLEISVSPVRQGSAASSATVPNEGWILILRDITKAKSLEEERDEFIGVVSHELRTPITVAEGTLSNVQLMMQRDDTNHKKLSQAVDLAHDQIVFLARMVNDLGTLSRAERGVADAPEAIDADELLLSLYHDYHSQAEDKGLRFDMHVPKKLGSINASRLYLKELLQNFVTNSIKYTHDGSIKISGQRDTQGDLIISVKDTGIGISKSDQKRVFDKFYRAEDYRTRETSGTGLGLYVAEKLARKLNATIEMKSRLNHGSTFSVTIPDHHKK